MMTKRENQQIEMHLITKDVVKWFRLASYLLLMVMPLLLTVE